MNREQGTNPLPTSPKPDVIPPFQKSKTLQQISTGGKFETDECFHDNSIGHDKTLITPETLVMGHTIPNPEYQYDLVTRIVLQDIKNNGPIRQAIKDMF